MDVYEVGGSIRDTFLGLPVSDRDWVVTGSTTEELEALGYRRVGKDFPVFLHPETGEEYALARTERKTAPGYRGFEIDASPTVTLEEDLARRDLTINAIARSTDGRIVDPFGGSDDLDNGILRHVSPAFVEDPVRVLRVARFAARFAHLGFTIAHETLALMREIAASGELDALQPERVWTETHRALETKDPDIFFETLRTVDALAAVFPEIDRLFGVPQTPRWHPEIDTGIHTMMSLRQVAGMTTDPCIRFAVLVHDLGKGTTPQDLLPRHPGHEARSVELIRELADRLRVPKRFTAFAIRVAAHHGKMHQISGLRAAKVHDLLVEIGALRDPAALDAFAIACEADARGRAGLANEPYYSGAYLREMLAAARTIASEDVPAGTVTGAGFGEALRALRIRAIDERRASMPLSDA